MKLSRIFVTGAGGFIGSHIIRSLLNSNHEVLALLAPDEIDFNLKGLSVKMIRGDIRDRNLLSTSLQNCDAVIHAAALNTFWYRPVKKFYEVNEQGTKCICAAAKAARIKHFVFLSSCDVMGKEPDNNPRDETSPLPQYINGHGERSKAFAEAIVRDHIQQGFPATIIRPTAVLGPNDIHGTPPGRLIRAFLKGKLPFYYDAGINMVDVRDVATAIVAALHQEPNGKIYLLGGHNLFISDLLQQLEKNTNIKKPLLRLPYFLASSASRAAEILARATKRAPLATRTSVRLVKHHWFFDCIKAQTEIKLSPRPFEETVRESLLWHQH